MTKKDQVDAIYNPNPMQQRDKRIAELEAERDRLREALQNIANGDTPWVDGYSKTAGEIYQKYAKQALEPRQG